MSPVWPSHPREERPDLSAWLHTNRHLVATERVAPDMASRRWGVLTTAAAGVSVAALAVGCIGAVVLAFDVDSQASEELCVAGAVAFWALTVAAVAQVTWRHGLSVRNVASGFLPARDETYWLSDHARALSAGTALSTNWLWARTAFWWGVALLWSVPAMVDDDGSWSPAWWVALCLGVAVVAALRCYVVIKYTQLQWYRARRSLPVSRPTAVSHAGDGPPHFDVWVDAECPLVVNESSLADSSHLSGIVTAVTAAAALLSVATAAIACLLGLWCAFVVQPHPSGEDSGVEYAFVIAWMVAIAVHVVWRTALRRYSVTRGLLPAVGPDSGPCGLRTHALAVSHGTGRSVDWLWARTVFWWSLVPFFAFGTWIESLYGYEHPAVWATQWLGLTALIALRAYLVIRYTQLQWHCARRSLPVGSQGPVSPSV